ncbi:MAG: HAMP domain-containing protein [Desulfomonile tiedjei]|nr:HAMP domain-containing protein [Desulfomonile tiedjei]
MIFSLEKRFFLLLLLPVALILIAVGVGGFMYARAYLLDQWAESTRLRLEKAAHEIKMKLDEKLELIQLIAKTNDTPKADVTRAYLVQQLLHKEGVRFVNIDFPEPDGTSSKVKSPRDYLQGVAEGLYTMELCDDVGFCAPIMDPNTLDRTLKIVKVFGGGDEGPVTRVTVTVSFDSFLQPIKQMGLWPGSSGCLVTSTGQLLAHTDKSMADRKRLGETGDELEMRVLSQIRQKPFGTVSSGGHPPDVVVGFYKIPFLNWYIMLLSEGSVIMEPMISFRFYYALTGIVSLIVILLLIRVTTRSVGKSIGEISAAAARVHDGDYSAQLPEERSDEIGQLNRSFNRMTEGLKQRDLIEQTFGRYVDKSVAEELMRTPEALRLGGEKQTVTIMMSDIRNFTGMSEKLQPEEVIKVMNKYFAKMVAVIERYKGIIVDFYGDSILVFFNGVESDIPGRAFDAVHCALEMQRELEALLRDNAGKGFPALGMGIGIHTGEVIVGNIGTETRAKYGIVGSNVNLTDRIQSTAGPGKVVVSEKTHEIICGTLKVALEFKACLKGVEEDQILYEVEAIDPECELRTAQ